MTPPPDWYPDPTAPGTERWWDGNAWTEHRRSTGTAPAAPEGRVKALALGAAGIVLLAAIATGVAVLGDDTPEARTTTPTTADAKPSQDETSATPTADPTSDAADPDPNRLVDQLNGVTLPIPDGWEKPEHLVGKKSPTMTTEGTYDCPGAGRSCRHGTVSTHTSPVTDGLTVRTIAEQDIEDAAAEAYDRDSVGRRPFNGIESRQRVGRGPVRVAGADGYYVRWRVETAAGPGGYVQSLAFPTPNGTGGMVVVRFAFDAGAQGPSLDLIQEITQGIRLLNP